MFTFTGPERPVVNLVRRKELLLDALVSRRTKHLSNVQSPFTTFVKKLQESLTRMESFDVVTVSQGSDGKPFPVLTYTFSSSDRLQTKFSISLSPPTSTAPSSQ